MPPSRPRHRRTALAVGALVALAAVVALVARGRGGRDVEVVQTDEERAAERRGPEIVEGPGALPAAPGGGRGPPRPPAEGEPTGEPAEADRIVIEGSVIDDATGAPLEGASVVLRPSEPGCPAPPEELFSGPDQGPDHVVRVTLAEGEGGAMRIATVPAVHARTGPDGRWTAPWVRGIELDAYARQPGYVVGALCRQPARGPVTVRLKSGLSIEGVVVRENGEPVLGATVECLPDPLALGLVGHRDVTIVGPKGGFVLRGLLPGLVRVTAWHPKFVATTSDPVEAGAQGVRLVLVPAFRVGFRLTQSDGKDPDTPTAEWRTDGEPPRGDLVLLQRADVPRLPDVPVVGPAMQGTGGAAYQPVVVPCDRGMVTFVVKAIGCEPWTSDPLEIPRDGGETTLEIALRRDPNLGRLVVRVEAEDGRTLSWAGEGCRVEVGRRDGQAVPAGIVLQAAEALDLPALPSGPYALRVLSPRHAPVRVEADVPAGGTEEIRVRLGPPARLRVRFTAPDPLVVRFRLVQGREVARPFPENVTMPEDAGAEAGEQHLPVGSEGIVLSGLGAGRYTVEVLSPDLVAPPTAVDLVEGETREVEISVRMK